MCDALGRIVYMGKLYPGANVDFGIFKKELLHLDYDGRKLWVDLGFQGICNYVPEEQVNIPFKTPKGGRLTQEEKDYNTKLSRVRALVENMIGGVKRYFYLRHEIRTHCRKRIERNTEMCVALQNYKLGLPIRNIA